MIVDRRQPTRRQTDWLRPTASGNRSYRARGRGSAVRCLRPIPGGRQGDTTPRPKGAYAVSGESSQPAWSEMSRLRPLSRGSWLSVPYHLFALRHLSPAGASVPQLCLQTDNKIRLQHRDLVEGQSNTGTGANPGWTRLPAVISRSCPGAQSLCAFRAATCHSGVPAGDLGIADAAAGSFASTW